MEEQVSVEGRTITITVGDITEEETDAIVNAANRYLLGGGGVDGAIHRAAGPELLEECIRVKQSRLQKTSGKLPTGQAVMTNGYLLKARHVIHTVGPMFGAEREPEKFLANAYTHSLKLAEDVELRSVSFPSIGTGIYGCPIDWAAEIALTAISNFLPHALSVREVRIVLFSNAEYHAYSDKMRKMFNT